MRHISIIIILILGLFGVGIVVGLDIQRSHDAPTIAELEFKCQELERYSGELEQVSKHYKVWLDKMTFDNKRAKADIERLEDACANLTKERDMYYAEIHKLLNPEWETTKWD